MILILSNKWDLTVDFVVAELHARRVNFIRLNTEDLASGKAVVSLPDFQILVSRKGKLINIRESIKVIWNRRPGKPFDDLPQNQRPSRAIQDFVNDQWYSWLEALQLLPDVTWINHPISSDAMESKIRQLFLATKIGFNIPDTLITNDAESALSLANKYDGRVVAKALFSPLIEKPDEDLFIFTNEICADDISGDEVRISPIIFQKPLLPKVDYRVTVVGNAIFPVRIDSSNVASIDWRVEKDGLDFVACELPAEISELCKRYVSENNLLFGALDLVEHNETFYFLEINPNGEWGWLQKPHNIPIAQTLCNLLIAENGKYT